MNTDALVRGALLAKERDGVGPLSAMETNTFQNLGIDTKTDFVKGYAAAGGREPQGNRYTDYLSHIGPEAAAGGAMGGFVNYMLAPSISREISEAEQKLYNTTLTHLPASSKAEFQLIANQSKGTGFKGIKQYGPALIRTATRTAKLGLIGGAALGAGLAAKHVFDRRGAVDKINSRLDEIRDEPSDVRKNHLAMSTLFSHEGYNTKRTAAKPSASNAVIKATKTVLNPLSINTGN